MNAKESGYWKTLYQIDEEIQAVLSQAIDGELTDDCLAQLELVELSRDAKVDAYCGLISQWESDCLAIDAQIRRLRDLKATNERNIDRLKANLIESMTAHDERRIDTALWKVWRQRNPDSCECVVDPALLPTAFQRVKIEADKSAAMKDYKLTGVMPEGFELKPESESLRIK